MKKFAYILCIAVVLSACANHHAEDHDEHECHEEHTLSLTAYNDDFELFAEVEPLAVGMESHILAHFSWVQDNAPLEKGSVTMSLIIGQQKLTQTVANPEESGIYHFELKPTQAGTGKLLFEVTTSGGKSELTVGNVTVYANEEEADHAAEHAAIHSPTAIKFTKEQSWKTDFATDYPQTIPFGPVIQSVAQVESAQGEEMVIVAKTDGVLTYIASDIFEGKAVTNGTTLFAVSGNGFIDGNPAVRLSEAKNNYNLAKQNYDRAKSLVDSKIVSQKEFMEISNTYENAKLIYENISKSVGSNGEKIASPLSGYLKQIMVTNGSYVSKGQPIAVVSQNKNLILKADIPQRYASYLSTVNDANIADPVSGKVYSLEELNGKILTYGRSVSAENQMLPLTIEISNTGSFTFGGFVDIWLRAQSNSQATVIPRTALTEEQGNYFVYVQLTPELFDKKEVKIGSSDGKNVEILSPLSPDQRIVTRGAMMVKLAKTAGALDAHSGHVH